MLVMVILDCGPAEMGINRAMLSTQNVFTFSDAGKCLVSESD